MLRSPSILAILLLFLLSYNRQNVLGKRVYGIGEQFPKDSEHLHLPPILLFSAYMGKMSYSFTPLTFESMRWNPQVHFTIINVIEDGSNQADHTLALANEMKIANLEIKVVTMSQLRTRVQERLNITVPFDSSWYYKLCDYKPVLAYLFPESFNRPAGLEPYKFWGYGDLDVVWGNFSRYAHWFQGDYPFVVSGWFGTTGAAAFYINEPYTINLFMSDPKFVPLLADKSYHNLDEGGTQTNEKDVVDQGSHAISWMQKKYQADHQLKQNYGKVWQDHCFLDQGDSQDWAGPVAWVKGNLRVVKGSAVFPPGRELLFYHRPEKNFDVPKEIRRLYIKDMIEYGYLLPNWIALISRFACTKNTVGGSDTITSLSKYTPYASDCFVATKVSEEEHGEHGGGEGGRE